MKHMIVVVSMALAAVGCGEKKAAGSDKADKADKADDKAPAAAPVAKTWKPLPKMNMQAEVPGDMEVTDASADAPGYVMFDNDCHGDINILPPAWPSTYEAEKADIAKDTSTKFKSFTKDEKTADGYHLEFSVEDSFEAASCCSVTRSVARSPARTSFVRASSTPPPSAIARWRSA